MNENWIQAYVTVVRWKHVSQKNYSNIFLMLLRHIGVVDVNLAWIRWGQQGSSPMRLAIQSPMRLAIQTIDILIKGCYL